jgi:predicted transcriptional regulator
MKNVTLSADEDLIDRARECARQRKSTLNALFRQWLAELVAQRDAEKRLAELELRMGYAKSGGPFTREEMNAR